MQGKRSLEVKFPNPCLRKEISQNRDDEIQGKDVLGHYGLC